MRQSTAASIRIAVQSRSLLPRWRRAIFTSRERAAYLDVVLLLRSTIASLLLGCGRLHTRIIRHLGIFAALRAMALQVIRVTFFRPTASRDKQRKGESSNYRLHDQDCTDALTQSQAQVKSNFEQRFRWLHSLLGCNIQSDMAKARPIEERFWAKVDRSGGDDSCWIWTGACAGKHYNNGGGYGEIKLDSSRQNIKAHHLSWILKNGEIPTGMHVCHTCDVTRCANPKHLWLGTHAENQADKARKGRSHSESRPGSLTPNSKLTETDIPIIRQLSFEGLSHSEIAARYQVATSNIGQILTGKTWTHVPIDPAYVVPKEVRQQRMREGAHKLRGCESKRKGSLNNKAKLTEADVPVIRQLYSDGWTQVEIAQRYKLSHVAVGALLNGKTWRHVP